MIRLVARWCPDRVKVLAVDGGYAAVKLALVCAGLEHTKLVMRFHWDAALHVRSARKADFVSLPAEDWQHVLSCLSATA
jgi:hypothetical protein